MNKYLIFILCIINIQASTHPAKKLTLRVFVHGSLRPRGKISDMIAIKKDRNVADTDYGRTNNYLRNHSFTRESQPMQDLGLHRITYKSPDSSKLAAAIISELNNKKDELVYTFGWTGLLSRSGRKEEGIKFYNELAQEIKILRSQNIDPRIEIIAFSHGGNVALNMVHAFNNNPEFIVDELILIGTPVQRDTDHLINSKLFSGIYHFYSSEDLAQGLDHLSGNCHYCHQRFAPRKGFRLPKKLKQIRIRVKKAFTPKCPSSDKNRVCVDPDKYSVFVDPGHIEMWFFGWCARGYREDYPLYPLPIAIFTPWLVKVINHLPSDAPHITANIYPQAGCLSLAFGTFCKTWEEFNLPFISCTDLQELKEWSLSRKPRCDVEKVYRQVIHEALKQGPLRRRCRDNNKSCRRIK